MDTGLGTGRRVLALLAAEISPKGRNDMRVEPPGFKILNPYARITPTDRRRGQPGAKQGQYNAIRKFIFIG